MWKYLLIIIIVLFIGFVIRADRFGDDTPIDLQLADENKYIVSERNYENIQYEELRKQIDPIYNQIHDALSQAYYENKEFVWNGVEYGILNKETFDKLHTMIWARYEILFHEENLKQGLYPESNYNEIRECSNENGIRICNMVGKKSDRAKDKIKKFKEEGIDIDL